MGLWTRTKIQDIDQAICHYLLCSLAKFIGLNHASHFEGSIYQLFASKYIFSHLFIYSYISLYIHFSQKMFFRNFQFVGSVLDVQVIIKQKRKIN